jgi:hypothetical protein
MRAIRGDARDASSARVWVWLLRIGILALAVAVWFQMGRPALDRWNVARQPAQLARYEIATPAGGAGGRAAVGAAGLTSGASGRPKFGGVPIPAPPADARPGRISPAVHPGPGGTHAFTYFTRDGQPILFDPCRPIHYVVRTEGMPQMVLEGIRAATRAVARASGLVFVVDGAVDEAPSEDRPVLQPSVYGSRWVPVLFAWSTPAEFPPFAAETRTAGLGGALVATVTGAGSARIVTGSVTLNTDNVTPWLSETRGPRSLELLLIHEIGHVLGLAHVTDRAELMDARPIAVGGLGAGDRQGFAIAGNGSCHDDT